MTTHRSDVDKGVMADAAPLVLESRRFGRLECPPDALLTFPGGLVGFEDLRAYALVAPESLEPLAFLVACDDPELAFPVLPASWAPPDYTPEFPPEALRAIGAGLDDPVELLLVVSLAPDTGTLHANLRGPLLINPATRIGCQTVLHDAPYSLRYMLTPG